MKIAHLFYILLAIAFLSACDSPDENYAPGTEHYSLEQAETQLATGNYTRAIEMYNVIIKEKDTSVFYKAHYNKAYCYYKLDNFDSCKKILTFVSNINETNRDYGWFKHNSLFMLGRIANKENAHQTAIHYFEKAIKFQESHEIYNTLAFTEMEIGRYQSALSHINMALEFKENSNALSSRAYIYLKLNNVDLAIPDIQKAIEMDSLNPYAFKYRAMINIELKKLKEACEDLHKANELDYRKYATKIFMNDVDSLLNMYCK